MSDVVVILEKLKEEGFSLWLDGEKLRYKAPKESITKANLLTLKRNKEEIIQVLQNYSKRIVVEVDSDNRYEPFPLTDVQTAYLMGRNNLFDYGGVACHVYLELKYKNLDVSRVRLVWNKLIQTHDMLRTVVFEEGYQQVLKEVPELEIPYWDVSKGENICEYNDFRQQMGNHVYDTGKWPMFGIAIAKKAEESILHFSMDFLIADWTSIWMLLSEFEALYYLKKDSINVPQITFRDYLSAERKLKESERYVNDKRYWEKRIAYLPDAPELPTLSAEDVKKNFTRKLLCLDSERWNSFKDAAKKLGITPSTAILTAYSDVIAKWSCNKSFCINLTVLNRFPLHDDVTDIVGDFTTLNLLEINANDGNNFAERARKINERLFIDLDHRLFGGVEVIRELSKQRNKRVFMPIVYTSAIGLADQNRQITGKFDGGITQTPQVFIDCQAMDGDFGLQINWDVREGVFPDGMIDDMFDLFQQRIEELAKDETDWNKINGLFLPQWQADERNVANHTETDLPIHLLQSGFMEWAQKAPDRVAVTDGEKKLTYGELHQYALKIRQKIVNVGAKHQDCIAIAMNKSIYQVAAVLGTLYAGCIYVPIVADQEIERAKKILEITNANIVLTTVAENSEYMSGKAIIEVDALSDIKFETELPEYGLEDVAYIIFTSGSTGEPKGVTLYGRIMAKWGNQSEVLLNLTVFQRQQKNTEKIIGDFTKLLPLNLVFAKEDIWKSAERVQEQIMKELDHLSFDGTEIMRELAKRRGVFGKALLPVVFTCVLFDCPENYFERLGSIKYAVSQTPQVFLDNQITEMGGRLHISWDVVDELFEACIIDEIFLEFVEDIKRISENNKANSTNDFVTKVWGNILTKEIITKSVVPDLLKNIDLKQIKILDYAQELCPPDVKGQVYVSESEIMNDRNKTYYKILEHPLYGRMADTGIIGVLTHDGYMEFVVPNCETSVETPDKKEDTHEEEIEKPIVKEIMKIWKEVFEIEDISIQDDFYTLGGDSIILMRLVDEMCKTLGCDVTVDDILQSENISDLANRV